MDQKFDVREYLEIPKDRPLEFRICHISRLWYEKILHESKKNYFDTVNDLFPNLVLRLVEGKSDQAPLYQDSDRYIKVCTSTTGRTGKINQGKSSMEYQVISRLVGAGTSKKNFTTARKIQNRVAKELCGDDDSKLTGLQSYYSDLINGLTRDELEDFKAIFMVYVNTVITDLGNFPGYKSPLFPFDSDEQVQNLNNNYLYEEFEAGNYAGFFLWMNLGALLRDRIQLLLITFDSTFDRKADKKEEPRASGDSIPHCLTPIPLVNRHVGLVGREDVKAAVRSMLDERGRMALVSGLGGIGKTAVMQYVCNDLKEEGKYVAWIDCGDSLKRDLLSLGAALGIDTRDPDNAYEQILLAVKTRLGGDLYLFLDNLTENLTQKELRDLNSLNAHIMVTSRKSCDAFPTVGLEVLGDDSAVTMFFRYYNGDTDRRYEDAARRTVSSVGRHTLLVELLARAAKRSGGTLEDFNTRLEAEGVYDVFRRKIDTAHDEKMTIEDCVIRLYETASLSDAQKHIMRLFSIFTPGKEIYYKVSEWAGLDMDAMDGLIDLGWIETSGPENNYKIHQIIKDSIVLQMMRHGEGLRIEDYGKLLEEVSNTRSYIPLGLEYTTVRERLTLTEDVANYLDYKIKECRISQWKNKNILAKATELFNNIACVFREQGAYGKALDYYGKAMVICEHIFGSEHPVSGMTYNNMAIVYSSQGRYEKALEYYEKALAIREREFGPDHPDTGTVYNNMAGVYYYLGEYDKSLEYYGKTLAIHTHEYGSEHPDTSMTYNNMAGVFLEQGEFEKALEYYGKALAIRECMFGPDFPSTGTTYHNMAGVFYKQGEYEKALEYYEKALAIREHMFGTNHPVTGTTYYNMAIVYSAQDKYEKALEYYEKDLAICKRVFGPVHPFTSTTYSNMASVLHKQGEYGKALKYYEKALAIYEHVFGPDDPRTNLTYGDISRVYLDLGDILKAYEYLDKVKTLTTLPLTSQYLENNVCHPHIESLAISAMMKAEPLSFIKLSYPAMNSDESVT